MKSWTKSAGIWLIPCWVVGTARTAWPASTHPPVDAVAIQAIQHAPDPSAVASAFANGMALDRSDPELFAAYVARMVEFGRPELAYRQAQALTILQPGNGLALGVVAYADARRGRMAEAITDINLGGQFAPENPFVARTAGELLAWYDLKADQTTFTEKARQGVARIRARLANQAAFTGAYATACQAYRAQPKVERPPDQAGAGQSAAVAQAPAAPPSPALQPALQGNLIAPQGYPAPVAAPPYYYPYPDYSDFYPYYDWSPDFGNELGPGSWQPYGFWGGSGFVPYGAAGRLGYGGRFGHDDHADEPRLTSATRPGGAGRIYYDFNYVSPPRAALSARAFATYREAPIYNGPLYSAPREAPAGRGPLAQDRRAAAFGGFQAPAFGGFQTPAFEGRQAPAFESPRGNRGDSLERRGRGGGAHR